MDHLYFCNCNFSSIQNQSNLALKTYHKGPDNAPKIKYAFRDAKKWKIFWGGALLTGPRANIPCLEIRNPCLNVLKSVLEILTMFHHYCAPRCIYFKAQNEERGWEGRNGEGRGGMGSPRLLAGFKGSYSKWRPGIGDEKGQDRGEGKKRWGEGSAVASCPWGSGGSLDIFKHKIFFV